MYCTDDPIALKNSVINSFKDFSSWKTIKSVEDMIEYRKKDLSRSLKEYLKAKKQYEFWTTKFIPFENPKNSKQFWGNAFYNAENSDNSMYKKTMAKARWQFDSIANGMIEYLSSINYDFKIIKKIERYVNTRKQKMI